MTKNNAINAPLPITEAKGGTNQTTYTTGDILYASASNTLSKLPIGPQSAVLVSDGTVPVWGNSTSNYTLVDDFINVDLNIQGWLWDANGTATAARVYNISQSGRSATNPGTHAIFTTTSGDEGFYGGVNDPGFGPLALGGGEVSVMFLVKVSNLSSGGNYLIRCGLGDTKTGDQANGCYFEYTDNVNSGNFTLKTANASTRTTANSNDTISTTVWKKLRINVNAAGTSVSFFVNDVECANSPIVTNIPTSTIGPFMYVKALTANDRYFQIDLFELNIKTTNAR